MGTSRGHRWHNVTSRFSGSRYVLAYYAFAAMLRVEGPPFHYEDALDPQNFVALLIAYMSHHSTFTKLDLPMCHDP